MGTSTTTTAPLRRMNWGCGDNRVEGWINSDRKEGPGIQHTADIMVGLGLASDSIDYVVSVHALQEVPPGDLVTVLKELHRVIRPGGVLRLVLPDAVKGFEAFRRGDHRYFAVPDEDAKSIGGKLALQLMWYGYSRSIFTPDSIDELLRKAGFAEVVHCEHGTTGSRFEGITELDNREDESLFVEAVKGPAYGAKPMKTSARSSALAMLTVFDHVLPGERVLSFLSDLPLRELCV